MIFLDGFDVTKELQYGYGIPDLAARGIGCLIVDGPGNGESVRFRNLPLILVVYTAYYVMPVATGLNLSPLTTGIVALSLNVSAYNGETFRAGIASIRKGQTEAAYALGMGRWQTMKEIVLPQAIRRVLPVLASTWVSLFKDTSLVSVISVDELAYTSMRIRAQTFRVLEMLTAMAAIYWLLGYPQAKIVDWINRRYGVKE